MARSGRHPCGVCEGVVALVLEDPSGSWALSTNLGWGRADSCALMIASYVSVGKRSGRRKDRRR
jgi:hypothetical protein